jgi:hypothetical protein
VEKNFMTMDQPQAEGDDLHYKDLLHLTCEWNSLIFFTILGLRMLLLSPLHNIIYDALCKSIHDVLLFWKKKKKKKFKKFKISEKMIELMLLPRYYSIKPYTNLVMV